MKSIRLKSLQTFISGLAVLGFICPAMANQNSDRIESSAKKSYVYKTYLKDDAIKIQVSNDSIVNLTGTVSDWTHLALAEETIAGLPGVRRVNNNLEVKSEKPPENSDLWIKLRIKTILMFHKNVSSVNTEVDVNNGVVSISGQASNEAQKELTTEYAMDVDGVRSVRNVMTIENKKTLMEKVGDNIDDASITAQVKMALLFHRSTSALKTKVETKNGIVTVSGVAKNSAEKDLVGKLVNNIKGVKSLKNEITIG